MLKKNRIKYEYLYYIAIGSSLCGISCVFLNIISPISFLEISIASLALYVVGLLVEKRGKLKNVERIMTYLLIIGIVIISLKLFYYHEIILIGPIMGISCFLVLISLIIKVNTFNYNYHLVINSLGAGILLIGMVAKSRDVYGALQIGNTNPQTIGAWAVIFALGALIQYDYWGKKKQSNSIITIVQCFIYVLMLCVTLLTESRFSTIILTVMLIIHFSPLFNLLNLKIIRCLCASIPFWVVFVSEGLYKTGLFGGMLGNSLLNGREQIWAEWITRTFERPFWGLAYNQVDTNSFYSHNIFVDYFVMFGVIVTLVYFIVLCYIFIKKVPYFSNFTKSEKDSNVRLKYEAFVAFIFILIGSSIEGCFFSVGAGGLFLFSYIPLMVVISKEE